MSFGNGNGSVVGTWLGRGRTHAILAQALLSGWSRDRSLGRFIGMSPVSASWRLGFLATLVDTRRPFPQNPKC